MTKRGPYRGTEARRREILDAAYAVFAQSGYRGGSLTDIAARIGIDASTILHHFGSKTALLEQVLRDKESLDTRSLRRPSELRPDEVPSELLRLAERNDAAPGVIALYAILAAESTTPGHPSAEYFRDRMARTQAVFADAFASMAAAGLLRDGVDAEFAARSTFALWDGIQLHWLIDPSTVSVTDTLRRHLRAITRVDV